MATKTAAKPKAKLNDVEKVNTSKSIMEPRPEDIRASLKKMETYFQGEKKVKMKIPAIFAKHLGSSFTYSVNGIAVTVPCDGTEFEINETHAKHIQKVMDNVSNRETASRAKPRDISQIG